MEFCSEIFDCAINTTYHQKIKYGFVVAYRNQHFWLVILKSYSQLRTSTSKEPKINLKHVFIASETKKSRRKGKTKFLISWTKIFSHAKSRIQTKKFGTKVSPYYAECESQKDVIFCESYMMNDCGLLAEFVNRKFTVWHAIEC